MKIAAVEPTSVTVAPTPAAAFVQQAGWLLAPGSVVVALDAIDATTVRMTVADPYVSDPHDRAEADRLAADSAMMVLEQAAHGVRLLPVTNLGYVGRSRELTPAQTTFLIGLPGVQRYDMQPEDLNGDGHLAPDEIAHHIDVDTRADAERLDWLLRDHLDDGAVHAGPITFGVPNEPFRLAPVRGAR
ncbi:MAG: hypothetical protein KDC46_07270 [Thermoleophilia bacterium]|nr:hypothetical protein [Thermoleophilia bacterium]